MLKCSNDSRFLHSPVAPIAHIPMTVKTIYAKSWAVTKLMTRMKSIHLRLAFIRTGQRRILLKAVEKTGIHLMNGPTQDPLEKSGEDRHSFDPHWPTQAPPERSGEGDVGSDL